MRVTQSMMVSQFLSNLSGINDKLILNQFKLARGVNFSKPSDGPLQIGHVLSYRSQEMKIAQFQKNISDGLSQVEYLDTLLQNMSDRITNVRTNVVHGADEALSSEDRKAVAMDIDQYLSATLEDSQNRFRDKYLFSGFETLTNPFSGSYSRWDSMLSSVDYRGDYGKINRRIGDLNSLPVNINGKDLFMENSYTLKGKFLPPDEALGFTGKLKINRQDIRIIATDTLEDIRDKINSTSGIKVVATTDSGYLKLESLTSSEKIKVSDDQNGMLLDSLGLNLRGAINRGISGPTMPVIDSTGAIFDAAGAVANLVYDSSNNKLNIHLGQNANDGVAEAHTITIPPKAYADTAELAAAIQTEVNNAFGSNKIIVEDVAGSLRFSTYETGATLGTADLKIGGEIDGVIDSASDLADLNLINSPDPAPVTDSQTAGTDGTDKFLIDLGSLVSRNGVDPQAAKIDLRAANTGTIGELIDEINYQISQDLSLRGLVTASEDNGMILFETTKTGDSITAEQLKITDSTTGTIAGLGIVTDPTSAYINGASIAAFPVNITAGANDTIVIDIGPSVSRSGINHDPITVTLRPGAYADITTLVNEINTQINFNPDLLGSLVASVDGLPGAEFVKFSSMGTGSDVNGLDLQITGGTALADLGLSISTAINGGGTAEGKGKELLPQNIFNTLIETRDTLIGYASEDTLLNRLAGSDGVIAELYEGDTITFEEEGRTFSFAYRATDTVADLMRGLSDFLGTKAEVRFDRSGRIVVENLTVRKISGLKMSVKNPDGTERVDFNKLLEIDSTVLGFHEVATGTLMDPTRHKGVADEYLAKIDIDMENILRHQAFVGATTNRLERTSTLLVNKDLNIKTQRGNIENANVADVIMQLSQQEAILEAALNVGSRVLTTSLLSYLR